MRRWLNKIFKKSPKTQNDLMAFLQEAKQRHLVHAELVGMIEGVLKMTKLQASDVMLPKPNMIVIRDDMSYAEIIHEINTSNHSRYPVVSHDNPDEVMGILLAKELLKSASAETQSQFQLMSCIRDAVVVPETKRLDALLKEFRLMHNHMAIVVDEYGSVSGLITIEDVLEEIVGEIEDEYDTDETTPHIEARNKNEYCIDAQLPLDEFNDYFKTDLISEEFNTIAGVLMHAFGYLPAVNETITLNGHSFKILKADERRIHQVLFCKK